MVFCVKRNEEFLSIELHQGQAKRAVVAKADAEVVGDHTGRFNSAGSAPRFTQASAGVFLGGGGATPHISHDTGFGQTPAYGGLGGAVSIAAQAITPSPRIS